MGADEKLALLREFCGDLLGQALTSLFRNYLLI